MEKGHRVRVKNDPYKWMTGTVQDCPGKILPPQSDYDFPYVSVQLDNDVCVSLPEDILEEIE